MELFLLNLLEIFTIVFFSSYAFFAVIPTQLFTHRTHARFATKVIVTMCITMIISGAFCWHYDKQNKLSDTEYFEARLLDAEEYYIYDTMTDAIYTIPSELPEFPFDIKITCNNQTSDITINSEADLPVLWSDIWQAYAMYEDGLLEETGMSVLTAGTILPITKGIDTQTFTLFDPDTGVCNGVFAVGIDNQKYLWTIADLWKEQLIRNMVLLSIVLAISSTKAVKFLRDKSRKS